MVKFGSETCPPCKAIIPHMLGAARTRPYLKLLSVNIKEAPSIAEHYGIVKIPTFHLVQDGRIFDQWSGGDPLTLSKKVRIIDVIRNSTSTK